MCLCVCSCCCASRKKTVVICSYGNVWQQKEKPKTVDEKTGRMSRLPGWRAESRQARKPRQAVSHKRQCAAVRQGSLLSTQLTVAEPKVSQQDATGVMRREPRAVMLWAEMRAIIYAQCQVIKNHLGQAGKRARIPGGCNNCAQLCWAIV